MQLEAANVLTGGGVRRTTQEGGKVPDVPNYFGRGETFRSGM